ncbi:MAG: hypothetical protein HN478_22470, partial [Rhodospirillaceae bacterium]|nr:hypothetical protein [Rhodospirillaceae bacterium]
MTNDNGCSPVGCQIEVLERADFHHWRRGDFGRISRVMWKSTVCARAGNNPATSRRFLLLAGLLCGLALVTAAPGARADNGGYFRIATGTTDGTY